MRSTYTSNKVSYPVDTAIKDFLQDLAKIRDIKSLLVFVDSESDIKYFGTFNAAVNSTGLRIKCWPLFLGDLTFNLLTATEVYLEFRDRVSWEHVSYMLY